MRIGVDFGTTRTVVAAALGGRYAVVTFEVGEAYREYVPGLAARDDAGRLRFGWEAARWLSAAPTRSVRSLKRAVRGACPDEPIEALGAPALGAVAGYLAHLRELLATRANLPLAPGEPLEAMVAVPANASTRQRYLTLEAFRAAGFEILGMMNEPTAAALEYAHRQLTGLGPRSPKRYLVVYDLGGGTFDASAVSLRDRHFEVLASEGIAELGGDDFDAELLELVLERLAIPSAALPPACRPGLLEACREAKESLGPNTRRVLVDAGAFPLGGPLAPAAPLGPVVVDAAELYRRTAPLVERTVTVLGGLLGALAAEGIDPEDPRQLAAVYLVGGSVGYPGVMRALRARWARKLKLAPQPTATTAVGLAIAADPGAAVWIGESTTRCFGVWREADHGREKVFDPIIRRDRPLAGEELVVERRYRPVHAVGHLRFMECSRLDAQGEPAGDIVPCGLVRFPYDPRYLGGELGEPPPPGALDAEEIVERYTYGRDGRVHVVIRNATRGYERVYDLGPAAPAAERPEAP